MSSWGQQFSSGDQSRDNRILFWKNDFAACPVCGGKEIETESVSAGCRHNGDGYGTDTFTCKQCQWSTSFQYDEADTPYYYETRQFREAPQTPRPPSYEPLSETDVAKFRTLLKIGSPPEHVRQMMVIKRHSPQDIDSFFASAPEPKKDQEATRLCSLG